MWSMSDSNGRQSCKTSNEWDLEIPTEFGSQMLMCVKFLFFREDEGTRGRVLSNSTPQKRYIIYAGLRWLAYCDERILKEVT